PRGDRHPALHRPRRGGPHSARRRSDPHARAGACSGCGPRDPPRARSAATAALPQARATFGARRGAVIGRRGRRGRRGSLRAGPGGRRGARLRLGSRGSVAPRGALGLARHRRAARRRVAFARRTAVVVVVMGDPLGRREPSPVATQLRETASWLVDLLFERTETVSAPEPVPARACRLATGKRIAFCSLVAGTGATTVAALAAQRAGGAGSTVRLIDLDLVAPTLSLLAGERTPTLLDALAVEGVRGRKWGSAFAIFGAERDPGPEVGEALIRFVRQMSRDAAVVLDTGTLRDRTDAILRACDA